MKNKLEYLPITKLSAYETNSRTHSKDQIAQIAASISEFGFTNPVLIDQENTIIAGHGRVEAAKQLGLDEVPCIRLSHLTEFQKKAYVIADNKLALNAGWDELLLRNEVLDLQDLSYDLKLLGFSEEELQSIKFVNSKTNSDFFDEPSTIKKHENQKFYILEKGLNYPLLKSTCLYTTTALSN